MDVPDAQGSPHPLERFVLFVQSGMNQRQRARRHVALPGEALEAAQDFSRLARAPSCR